MTPAALVGEVAKLASKLPEPVLKILVSIVRALLASKDPVRAVERAAKAAGAKVALDEALKKTLGRKR